MTDHELLAAVGEINEKYINNAANVEVNVNAVKKHKAVYRWAVVAACLCIITGGAVYMISNGINIFYPGAGSGVDGTGHPGGENPGGIDPVVASIAVYPPADRSLDEIENATFNVLSEEEAYNTNDLGEHLPTTVINGYHFRNSSIYETTMKDGEKYYMLRVDFTTGDESVADYLVQLTNYKPMEKEEDLLTLDSITRDTFEKRFFTVKCGDVYVGMNPGDLGYDEVMMVLNSIQ